MNRLNRRSLLKLAGTAAYALASFEAIATKARAQVSAKNPVAKKLLFIVSAGGGASIVDSFLAVKQSEAGANAGNLICYDDSFVTRQLPNGIRALDLPDNFRSYLGTIGKGTPFLQSTFVDRNQDDLAVLTMEGTSVNHLVAQKRAMNGFGINGNRTLLEEMASRHVQSLLLPNINMTSGGYLEGGDDPTLDERAQQEIVADARFFSLSTDGIRGLMGAPGTVPVTTPSPAQTAPVDDATLKRARDLLSRARGVRDQLDDASTFGKTFQCSPLRQKLIARRKGVNLDMEAEALITNLTLIAENDLPEILGPQFQPLSAFGLSPAPGTEDVRRAFDPVGLPGLDPGTRVFVDTLLAQACLAFLLARFGLSCSMAFGPQLTADINTIDVNPPLSFDFSHQAHVATQSVMWSRILDVIDKLVTLLKATDCGDGSGDTMWDRSTIYVATDFGRDKARNVAGQPLDSSSPTSTAHHLNNGNLILSPNIKAGAFGGVDASTLLTYGFDPNTGAPATSTVMREGHIYSAVLRTLGWKGSDAFPGQIDLPCIDPA